MTEDLSLAAEFPVTTEAQWRKLVETALKGASFDERLVSQTYDGLRVEPLYTRAASAPSVAGRSAMPWQVLQRIDHPDPVAANTQALLDLENGATGLSLVFAGSVGAYGYGLDGSPEAIARVLKDVHLDAGIALELDLSPQHKDTGRRLAALIKQGGVTPAKSHIRFGYDPLGAMARSGSSSLSWPQIAKQFTGVVTDLAGQGFKGPFAAADGRSVHAAGGSEAQELAFVIGNAVAYLRALSDAGVALDAARRMIFFRLAVDADEFLAIAKLRALRKMWARIEQASGMTALPAFVSAETAWRKMTQHDPYMNMLRMTIAVTAAGVAGADSICTLPFTLAIGLPDGFARRVARNMQLILLEESNLYRVADPAAGSGGIEALTSEIVQAAWKLFQEVEAAGGAGEAIPQGLLQKKVAETRAAREAKVARREDAITGTSDYPNLGELPVRVLDVPRVTVPAESSSFEPLPAIRLAEPFEALRNASDAFLKRTGKRPQVFLANLGTLSDFTTRATFAKNFYEAGGIEAVSNDRFMDQAAMLAAFKKSHAKLACLTSSDRVYEAQAAEAAKALAAADATVQLAGRPGANEGKWRRAGVKTFIFAGCDALMTLRATHDILGIEP